eukprot:gene12141-5632_t
MRYYAFCIVILLSITCLCSAEIQNEQEFKATTSTCTKSQLTAMIISLFAGYTGADRFYLQLYTEAGIKLTFFVALLSCGCLSIFGFCCGMLVSNKCGFFWTCICRGKGEGLGRCLRWVDTKCAENTEANLFIPLQACISALATLLLFFVCLLWGVIDFGLIVSQRMKLPSGCAWA